MFLLLPVEIYKRKEMGRERAFIAAFPRTLDTDAESQHAVHSDAIVPPGGAGDFVKVFTPRMGIYCRPSLLITRIKFLVRTAKLENVKLRIRENPVSATPCAHCLHLSSVWTLSKNIFSF